MDQLIRQFAEKTPVHLLDEHRRQTHKNLHDPINTLLQSIRYAQSENLSSEGLIVTGSMVEGASFARLFSPDSKTSGEIEADFMIPLVEWYAEEFLMYVDSNKVFVHILVDSSIQRESILSQVRLCWGEYATEDKVFCQKEDGIYMSSQEVKNVLKEGIFRQSPNVLNNYGFRPCIADKNCEAESASLAVQIDEVIDDEMVAGTTKPCGSEITSSTTESANSASREARIIVNANDRIFKLIKEMVACCENFEIRIAEMLTHLQTVQDELMDMRSEELSDSVSIQRQVSKALEWAMICVDITDLIFDTRKSTVCHWLNECFSTNIQEETQREKLKQKLKIYIDQLTVWEDDFSDGSLAAAICQLLSDIEREDVIPKLFLVGFREFARQQAVLSKNLKCMIAKPELSQIPEPLQQLAGSSSRTSYDIVPCFKLLFWPSVAAEWKTRSRMWPDQLVIDNIVGKGSHLVGKAFCHEDIDWRLSFSVAEIELATRWSPAQHFVYFIFKSLFYKFIKPLSSDNTADASVSPKMSSKKYVASYLAKTIMMWTSESVDQSWWTEDNAAECLTVLLLAMQSAFECRTLDHYFVSSVNLLEGLPDVLASRVVDTINSILADPAAIVDQLKAPLEKTEFYFNAMSAQNEYAKNCEDYAKLFSELNAFSI